MRGHDWREIHLDEIRALTYKEMKRKQKEFARKVEQDLLELFNEGKLEVGIDMAEKTYTHVFAFQFKGAFKRTEYKSIEIKYNSETEKLYGSITNYLKRVWNNIRHLTSDNKLPEAAAIFRVSPFSDERFARIFYWSSVVNEESQLVNDTELEKEHFRYRGNRLSEHPGNWTLDGPRKGERKLYDIRHKYDEDGYNTYGETHQDPFTVTCPPEKSDEPNFTFHVSLNTGDGRIYSVTRKQSRSLAYGYINKNLEDLKDQIFQKYYTDPKRWRR